MAPTRRCQYINCRNTSGTHSLFRFPIKDTNRLRIWINNSGNIKLTTLTSEELNNRYLCEVHFDACYKNQNDQQRRLVGTAIPRRRNSQDEAFEVVSSVSIREHPLEGATVEVTSDTSPTKLKVLTPKNVYGKRAFHKVDDREAGSSSASSQFDQEMNMPSPKKIKRDKSCMAEECLKRKRLLHTAQIALKNNKAQIKRLKAKPAPKNIFKKTMFPSTSSQLIATMQMRRNKRKWTKEERRFSLALFYKSPTTYNFLRDQGVVLPAVSCIKRWLSESDCLPGVTKKTFSQIETKFENATHMERTCVLMLTFDEMSIMTCLEYTKKNDFIEGFEDFGRGERSQNVAKYALVFLARAFTLLSMSLSCLPSLVNKVPRYTNSFSK
ncbi:uncharacterized protein LOC134801625 [Cydia splendana]|uniref:uncharacterized protein LOC134801625 n=1 Tax=Cydia splendana TaxID=1100963 RepID=UPI00300CE887